MRQILDGLLAFRRSFLILLMSGLAMTSSYVLAPQDWRWPLLALATIGVIVVAGWWVRRWFALQRQKQRRVVERSEELQAEVSALDTQEARRQAEQLLSDVSHFICTRRSSRDQTGLEAMGPCLRQLFGEYDRIDATIGSTWLARADLKEYPGLPDFLCIGTDVEWDLVVQPGADTVFIAYEGTEPPVPEFPTVYHFIIFFVRELTITR